MDASVEIVKLMSQINEDDTNLCQEVMLWHMKAALGVFIEADKTPS